MQRSISCVVEVVIGRVINLIEIFRKPRSVSVIEFPSHDNFITKCDHKYYIRHVNLFLFQQSGDMRHEFRVHLAVNAFEFLLKRVCI